MNALLRVEDRGPVRLLGLNRPEKHNAIDQAMVDALRAALEAARAAPCVLVVHSTTPGVFVSGADITTLLERDADAARQQINALLFDLLAAHPWPTVAAVDGPALGGGCELALACDLRVASPAARFGQPEPALGIIAAAGANWRLPQAVGLPMARRMLLAGEVLDAEAALTAGLVDAVHPSEALLDEAVALGERIATRSWRALELTKVALAGTQRTTTSFDREAQAELFDSADKRERMTAFLAARSRRREERAAAAAGSAGDRSGAQQAGPRAAEEAGR